MGVRFGFGPMALHGSNRRTLGGGSKSVHLERPSPWRTATPVSPTSTGRGGSIPPIRPILVRPGDWS